MIEDKNPQRTSISQLGEFGLIEHLTKNFKINHPSTLKGIGPTYMDKTGRNGLRVGDLSFNGDLPSKQLLDKYVILTNKHFDILNQNEHFRNW